MADELNVDPGRFVYAEGEEALIAYLLQNREVDKITNICKPHHFHNSFHKNVYRLCREYVLGTGRGVVDFNAVMDMIRQKGRAVGDNVNYLQHLGAVDLRQYPAPDYTIERLGKFSKRRRLMDGLLKQLTSATDADKDIDMIMNDTEDVVAAIEKGEGQEIEVFSGMDIYERRRMGLQKRLNTRSIYSGWPQFDSFLTVGFAPGKISVIAGRTSIGKSFFKTNLMINMCQDGTGIANICPEQGFDSEQDRMDAVMAGIHLSNIIRLRDLKSDSERERHLELIRQNTHRIASDYNYHVIPTRAITVAGVRTAIRRIRRRGGKVDMVLIDLFDRLDDVNVARERTATISVKLNQIERIADEENVHICLLVQINRAPESRRDKRPTISDLRDCGNFEQDADIIFLLYREGYYNREIEDNMLEVQIAKQRDGIAGLWFNFLIADKRTLKIIPMGEKQVVTQNQSGS